MWGQILYIFAFLVSYEGFSLRYRIRMSTNFNLTGRRCSQDCGRDQTNYSVFCQYADYLHFKYSSQPKQIKHYRLPGPHLPLAVLCYMVAAPMVEASIAEDSFDGGDLIQFRGSAGGAPGSAPAILAEGAARPALQLRSHFPETWLFSLQPHSTRLLR